MSPINIDPETNTLFRNMPVFAGLTDETLRFLLSNAEPVDKVQGDYFFREGEQAGSFFVLLSGILVVEQEYSGGIVEIRSLLRGDCFGEMSIVDLQNRSASVRVSENSKAIEISRQLLMQLLQRDLEQYAILMMNMGREISRRLRTVARQALELEMST